MGTRHCAGVEMGVGGGRTLEGQTGYQHEAESITVERVTRTKKRQEAYTR